MTKTLNAKIGVRDLELLSAIDRHPLTPSQLCRLSQSFAAPFHDEENLRRRLRTLTAAGLVKSWPYAVASAGRSPQYFRLTRAGYRLLYGADAALPNRRCFEAMHAGHHPHSLYLAELLVHLIVSGHRHGCTIESFARENSVKLEVHSPESDGGAGSVFTMFPDCAFVVRTSDGRRFPFVVELDNGTERIRSRQDVESVERKLRGYDAHQSRFDKFHPDRYLVLIVSTRSKVRLDHILSLAASVMHQPLRTVFLGADLPALLAGDPYWDSLFVDHRGLKRALVPLRSRTTSDAIMKSPQFVPSMSRSVVR